MSPDLTSGDVEILQGFIQESSDMLEQLESIIIELGQIPRSADDWLETMNAIFRLFHSMNVPGFPGYLSLLKEVKVADLSALTTYP